MGKLKNTPDKFWGQVDIRGENECWNWKGARFFGGYGRYMFNRRQRNAHAIAWELANGRAVREGYLVAHTPIICHNRLCCNPAHLSEKTYTENATDRDLDGTMHRGDTHYWRKHPEETLKGEKNGEAKLTWEQVREIRDLARQGVSRKEIEKRFGVRHSQLSNIILGKNWKE